MHTTTESKSLNTLFQFLWKPVKITVRSSRIIFHRWGIWGLSLTHLLKTLLLTFAYVVMMTYTSVWPSRGIHTPQHWNSDSWTYPLTRNETRGKILLCLSQLGRLELCLTALQSTAAREPPDSTTHNSPDDSLSKTTEVLFNLKWSATDTLLN